MNAAHLLAASCWVLAITVALCTAPPPASAGEPPPTALEEAELFFELNDTDHDVGIHATVDGDDWRRLTIKPADGKALLDVEARGNLRKQGLTELSFESAEPTFDELPPEEFFERFPEGEYLIKAKTLEGDVLENTVTITHVMPAPPVFVTPPFAPCDDPVSVTPPVTVDWEEVDSSHPDLGTPGEIVVERYEVAIERADSELTFFMELPPDVTSFPVPSLFASTPGVVKVEVLVKAENGNRTAEETCFQIE